MIKPIVRALIPLDKRFAIKQQLIELQSHLYSHDLNKLATLHKTDKWNGHWYTQHYSTYFKPFRRHKLNILEIGVGGYKDPNLGGNSLKMWKYFFPNSIIFGIDIQDKKSLQEDRIKIFQGSQVDEIFLSEVVKTIGKIDIIIDDGSHMNEHIIQTFNYLFPLLEQNGIYVVEDTQTSYWPEYNGDSTNLENPKTMMNYFKSLTDCVNHEEFLNTKYTPSYFDKNITSIQFFHNLIFIKKGKNNEGSNMVLDGRFKHLR